MWERASKNEFQLQLYLAGELVERYGGRERRLHALPPEQSDAERLGTGKRGWIGVGEVGVIKRIEEIGPELQPAGLSEPGDSERFRNRQVHVPEPRSREGVPAEIALDSIGR